MHLGRRLGEARAVIPQFREDAAALVALAALAGLVFSVGMQRHAALWDESAYLNSIRLYERMGLTRNFLRDMFPGSSGPLLCVWYSWGTRLLGYSIRGARMVSLASLIGAVGVFTLLLQQLKVRSPVFEGLALLACPIVLVLGGLVMPEVSSLFFFCASLYFLGRALAAPARAEPYWFFAGLLLALAALCRQNVLVLAVPVTLVTLRRRWFGPLFWYALSIAALVGPVFFFWRGLVPPRSAHIAHGFSWANGTLGLGGTGAIFFLLYHPARFLARAKWFLALWAGAIFLLYLNAGPAMFSRDALFLSELGKGWITGFSIDSYPSIAFAGVIALAALLILEIATLFWQGGLSDFEQIVLLGLLCVGVSPAKITYGFSARYLISTVPLTLCLGRLYPADRFRAYTVMAGAIGGLTGIFYLLA
jgi:hypothetical protein